MPRRLILLMIGALVAPLAARAQPATDVVEVRHGNIVGKRVVERGDSIPAGAIIGALVGLGTAAGKSSGTKFRRSAGGAFLGGLVANEIDEDRQRWLYTVRFPDGSREQIVIQDHRLSLGDCAAVEYGQAETRVRYASRYFCQP